MRILLTSAHRALVGGVEKYLQALIPALLERGHAVGLLHEHSSRSASETVDPAAGGLQTWCLADDGLGTALQSVAAWKPDVVYCHGLETEEAVALESDLQDRYPTILYVHNYDRTCATGRKFHSFPQPKSCERRLGGMCLVLHYPLRCGGWHPRTMWRRFQQHTQLNARLPYHRAILVASTHMCRELERHGVAEDRLHMVPLPTTDVIPDAAGPRRRAPGSNILFVGRLTDVKGCDFLIRAIPRASEQLGRSLTLTVAGDGPELPNLQQLAAELGVDVKFAGWVHTREKLELMRRADLIAVPSLWPEPFGLVGIEAACLGVPAAGYAVGGILDWLIPGETGELAPASPPTHEGLADALTRALGSPDHYGKLCRGAWEFSKRFSIENHLARLEPILDSSTAPLIEAVCSHSPIDHFPCL